jgi:hypothetical protein
MADLDSANAQNGSTNVDSQHDEQVKESTEQLNARLLRESKEWKSKYLAAKQESQSQKHVLEEAEKKKMESQQQYKTLAEKYESENKALKDRIRNEKIRNAVNDKALRAGCVNVEDLLTVGDKSLIEYDEESNQVSGAEVFIEETRRLKPYLFQSKANGRTSTINSVTPGSVPDKKISAVDVASMKSGDPRKHAAWTEAFANASTQRR